MEINKQNLLILGAFFCKAVNFDVVPFSSLVDHAGALLPVDFCLVLHMMRGVIRRKTLPEKLIFVSIITQHLFEDSLSFL